MANLREKLEALEDLYNSHYAFLLDYQIAGRTSHENCPEGPSFSNLSSLNKYYQKEMRRLI